MPDLVRKPASASNNGELDSSAAQVIPGAKTFSGAITPSGGIVGKTDGVAVGSGLVGETQTTQNTAGVSLTTGGVTAHSVTVTAGVWLLLATVMITGATGGDNIGAYWSGLAANNADVNRQSAGSTSGSCSISVRPRVVTSAGTYNLGAENSTASRGAVYTTIVAIRIA